MSDATMMQAQIDSLKAMLADALKGLAASQAREHRLREALAAMSLYVAYNGDDWVKRHATEALSLPGDDSALREMIEAEREACAAFVERDCADNQMADPRELKEVAVAIRSRGEK